MEPSAGKRKLGLRGCPVPIQLAGAQGNGATGEMRAVKFLYSGDFGEIARQENFVRRMGVVKGQHSLADLKAISTQKPLDCASTNMRALLG